MNYEMYIVEVWMLFKYEQCCLQSTTHWWNPYSSERYIMCLNRCKKTLCNTFSRKSTIKLFFFHELVKVLTNFETIFVCILTNEFAKLSIDFWLCVPNKKYLGLTNILFNIRIICLLKYSFQLRKLHLWLLIVPKVFMLKSSFSYLLFYL